METAPAIALQSMIFDDAAKYSLMGEKKGYIAA